MESYYAKRAPEYEEIYNREGEPKRREELEDIASALKETLKDRNVLEIACGTGYWTQILSRAAKKIVATDIAKETLEIAQSKKYSCTVHFIVGDAYSLTLNEKFDGGLANFWFSHVPRERMGSFLARFHANLENGSIVFMADNVYVPGVGGELSRSEGDKMNTYKLRKLSDGSSHLVLKNYFSKDELAKIFSQQPNVEIQDIYYGSCYWSLRYRITREP